MTRPDTDQPPEAVEVDRALFDAWRAAAKAVDDWQFEKDRLAAEIMYRMGTARRAMINGEPVLTQVGGGTRNRFSQSRFKQAMPDLYNDFCVPEDTRPFLRQIKPSDRRG